MTKTRAREGGGGSTEGAVTLNNTFLGAQAFGALIQEHTQFLTTSTKMWFGSCIFSAPFPSSWAVQPVCGSHLQQGPALPLPARQAVGHCQLLRRGPHCDCPQNGAELPWQSPHKSRSFPVPASAKGRKILLTQERHFYLPTPSKLSPVWAPVL